MLNKKHFKLSLTIVSILLLFLQPYYSWFAADDFNYVLKVKESGLINNMWHEYLNWDGRSISLTYPVCRFGAWTGIYWVGPLVGTLLLVVIAHLMLKISEIKVESIQNKIFNLILLTSSLWLVCFYFASQTLYWTTGIGYNMDIVMLFMSLLWLQKKPEGMGYYLAGIPIFFYAGTCSPNGVLALFFLLFTQWLYEALTHKSNQNKKYLFALFFIGIAFLMVVLSPGNSRRMTGWDWKNLTHIWTVYFNIKTLLGNLVVYNSPMLWPYLFLGVWGALLWKQTQKEHEKSRVLLRAFVTHLYAHRYFFAAVLSFLFFLPLPGMNSPRTNIQFAMFTALYGLSYLPQIIKSLENAVSINQLQQLGLVIMGIFILTAGSQVFDARYVKGQMKLRETKLKSLKGEDVVLSNNDMVRTPATRVFEDLATDSSYWLNRSVAEYYGLKSVKLVDTAVKTVNYGRLTK